MLICMRTTLNLDDELAAAAKREAARRGQTFTSLLEEGLRGLLDQADRDAETRTASILRISREMGARAGRLPDPQELLYDDAGLPR